MCRKRIDGATIRCGSVQSRVICRSVSQWRTLLISLPFMILVMSPRCETRDLMLNVHDEAATVFSGYLSICLLKCLNIASNIPSIQRFITTERTYKVYREDSRSNYLKDDWQQEHLYVGRSGDPWGTVSVKQQENVYMHALPSINSTFNDTKHHQLLRNREESLTRTRFKRGVIHLYNMVVCATGCNPLAYKGYGCYCGFLGSGYVIDGIDRCCKMHDWCYDATECPMFSEYFVPYYWKCYHGYKPICAVEHGDWGGSGSCAQRLCECDRSLAECLRRYPCPTTKAVCTSSPWRLVQNLFMIM